MIETTEHEAPSAPGGVQGPGTAAGGSFAAPPVASPGPPPWAVRPGVEAPPLFARAKPEREERGGLITDIKPDPEREEEPQPGPEPEIPEHLRDLSMLSSLGILQVSLADPLEDKRLVILSSADARLLRGLLRDVVPMHSVHRAHRVLQVIEAVCDTGREG